MKTAKEYYQDVYPDTCQSFNDWIRFAEAYAEYRLLTSPRNTAAPAGHQWQGVTEGHGCLLASCSCGWTRRDSDRNLLRLLRLWDDHIIIVGRVKRLNEDI